MVAKNKLIHINSDPTSTLPFGHRSKEQNGLKHKSLNTNSMRAESRIYVNNPNPIFKAPRAYREQVEVEERESDELLLDKSKATIDKLTGEIRYAEIVGNNRKKQHYFIRLILKRIDQAGIFQNDYMVKSIGLRRGINLHRRNVIIELFRAFGTYHCMFTGVLGKSCITTLSDQIGATTYGSKRYGKYAEKKLPVDSTLGKKKSISRVSRALADLDRWGLIERHYDTDEVTGKNLPAIIRVTDLFYEVLLFDEGEVNKARFNKLRNLVVKQNIVPIDFTEQQRKEMINQKLKELRIERKSYATLKRRRKYYANMTRAEIHGKAQHDVMRRLGQDRLEAMSIENFRNIVKQREKEIYSLINDPTRPDSYGDNLEPDPPDNFIHS